MKYIRTYENELESKKYKKDDYVLVKNKICKLTGESYYIPFDLLLVGLTSDDKRNTFYQSKIERKATVEEIDTFEKEKEYDTNKYNL